MRYVVIALIVFNILTIAFAQDSDTSPAIDYAENCQEPLDDYTQIAIRDEILNARTLAMLAHAQTLYDGPIDLTGRAITQGSYNGGGVALSFGTHDGGGAVDVSVRNLPIDWSILWDDIEPVIMALRTAGFAAWYRDEEDGMSPHIHAIAIGDAELSEAAALQIDGRYGYLRGFDGLPQADGIPQFDMHTDIVICDWMRELGYDDLREASAIPQPPYEIAPNATLIVNTVWGNELNLRAEPGLGAEIIARLSNETPVTVLDGFREADGFRWWLLRLDDGRVGWAVDAVDGGLTLVPPLGQ